MEQVLTLQFEHFSSHELLPADDLELIKAAQEAAQKAHAPYSEFHVGAAARLKGGKILSAANCESEVFPSGMCAERSLLYYLQTNHPDDPILALAIASSPATRECTPCGSCRQAILDAQRRQASPIRIIMSSNTSATAVASAEILLPFSFRL